MLSPSYFNILEGRNQEKKLRKERKNGIIIGGTLGPNLTRRNYWDEEGYSFKKRKLVELEDFRKRKIFIWKAPP